MGKKKNQLLANTWAALSSGLTLLARKHSPQGCKQKFTLCCSQIKVPGVALSGPEAGLSPGSGESWSCRAKNLTLDTAPTPGAPSTNWGWDGAGGLLLLPNMAIVIMMILTTSC